MSKMLAMEHMECGAPGVYNGAKAGYCCSSCGTLLFPDDVLDLLFADLAQPREYSDLLVVKGAKPGDTMVRALAREPSE